MGVEDIFDNDQVPTDQKHILIEGEAGIGKSTLCRKLAFDWAKANPCDIVTQQFELVFLLEASRLEDTVMDSIYSLLLPDDFVISKEELAIILSKPSIQENVLFIIDAYDELSSQSLDFCKLLKGKIYSRSMVVMTTRPSYANDIIKYFDSGYVVLGYPYHKRKEFIRKYAIEMESDIKLFKALEDNLQENDSLCDLSRIPLFLWFICMLVEDNEGKVPSTRTDLFTEITNLLLRKTAMKHSMDPEELASVMVPLCQLAFMGMRESATQLSESVFRSICQDDHRVLQLGFLLKEKSRSRLRPKVLYGFTHKTIQEFLAAKYLRDLPRSQMLGVFTAQSRKQRKWDMVVIFLSGLLKGDDAALEDLFKHAICRDLHASINSVHLISSDEMTHSGFHLGLQCLAECGLFATFEPLANEVVPPCFVYHVMTCHYCLEGYTTSLSRTALPHGPDLVIHAIDLETYQMFDYKLLDAVTNCRYLPSIVFSEVLSIHVLLQYMTKFCNARRDLARLYIYLAPFMHPEIGEHDHDLVQMRALYGSLSSLKSLVFAGSESRLYKGAESIAQGIELLLVSLLSNLGSELTTIALCDHTLTPESAAALLTGLMRCSALQKLILEDIETDQEVLAHIMTVLEGLRGLKDLTLSRCGSEGGLPLETASAIFHNDLVKICFLQMPASKEVYTKILSSMENKLSLTHLNLSDTILPASAFEELCQTLSTLPNLTTLILRSTGFATDILNHFIEALSMMPSLQELDISGNDLCSSGCFACLCQTLAQISCLHSIELDYCNISDDNVKDLGILFSAKHVEKISLMGNPIGISAEGVDVLLESLDNSTSLRVLHITCSKFTPTTAIDFCDSISGNFDLSDLSISSLPCPELMSRDAITATYGLINSQLPSVTSFSLGFSTNVRLAHKPLVPKHMRFREECLEF